MFLLYIKRVSSKLFLTIPPPAKITFIFFLKYYHLLYRCKKKSPINLGTGQEYTIQDIANIVKDVLEGNNLNKVFQKYLQENKINPKDISQIKDLVFGTLRSYGKTKFVINKLVKRTPSNQLILTLLHIALFQLIFNRSNSYTVVDQAVSASNMINKRHTKFVNGVLRSFLREKVSILDKAEKIDEAKYSYPIWWINLIKNEYPKSWENILDIGNSHPPLIIRVNIKKGSISNYIKKLEKYHIEHLHLGTEAILIKKPIPIDSLPGFKESLSIFQIRTTLRGIHTPGSHSENPF